MNRLKLFLLRQIEKISAFSRGIIRATATLFGVRKTDNNKYEYGQVVMAIGVFIIGTPLAMLLLGPYFNPTIWLAVVLAGLWLVNLDETLLTITTMVDYGVDNPVGTESL